MKQLMIRQAHPEDAEILLEYLKRVGGESDNLSFGGEGLPFTPEQEAHYLQQQQDDPRSVVFLAFANGELIGDGSLAALPRRMSHRAELGLSVVKDFWHMGVGTALLENLMRFAKTAGLEVITLEVRSDNVRAIRLYEKFGFQRVGTHPANMKIDESYIDVDIMYCKL